VRMVTMVTTTKMRIGVLYVVENVFMTPAARAFNVQMLKITQLSKYRKEGYPYIREVIF